MGSITIDETRRRSGSAGPRSAEPCSAEILRRERYLRAVAEMQRALSSSSSADLRDLAHVLAPLGQASEVSRVYLFENHPGPDGRLLMSQRAEWCAEGIQPEIDNPDLQDLSYDDFFPRWAELLSRGEPICDLVREMPDTEREVLQEQSILSILVLPVHVQGAFVGFIGFDDCVRPRLWSELEVDLLSAAAINIGLFLDQRRARETLEVTNHELVRARDEVLQAMRAKTTFLAKVSHELRTPLNAVLGYAELVLDDLQQRDIDNIEEDANRIIDSGRYLLSMVDDLLTLTQLGAGESVVRPTWVDLDVWLQELLELWCHPHVERRVAFEVRRDGRLGRAYTDPRRLNQILLNLLSNAVKYTPQGQVVLRASAQADQIVLSVEDTGIGMAPDSIRDIFEEFYQADPSCTGEAGGVGLGLAITKRLCDALGATLKVESEVGVGSCFAVMVPRQAAVLQHPDPQRAESEVRRGPS